MADAPPSSSPALPGLDAFRDRKSAARALAAIAQACGEPASAAAAQAAKGTLDPDRALAALERVLEGRRPRHPEDTAPALWRLALLGIASDFLPRLIARRPRLYDWLACERLLLSEKGPEDQRRELDRQLARLEASDLPQLMRILRRHKYRELLRIAARDLTGEAGIAESARELSALAEASVGAAISFLDRMLRLRHGAPEGAARPGDGFCALGMGKLGGRELNFSSDIDLILFYERDGTTAGPEKVTHFQHYAKLGELLAKAIGEVTEDGFCFRVDLNLRPDGRSGPIVSSLEAMEGYYEAFGRTWERAALSKARPVGGDPALGERLLEGLRPFVWRRSVDFAMLDEMRALKAQIDRRALARGDDVKLGPGGIREVEFFIQSLQLLHGGRNPRLRERSTLGALSNALYAGLLTGKDHDALADAYVFLRRLEHRLQMVAERQTHTLPEDEATRQRVASAMGYAERARFEADLARHRAAVSAVFGDILQVSGAQPRALDAKLAIAVDPDAPEETREAMLAERGFRRPDDALSSLARLSRDRASPFARRGAPAPEAVSLLADCAASPDPDQALFHLAEFFAPLVAPAAFYDLLGKHPTTARLLTSLFGTSDFLSRYFLRHPELIDSLVRVDAAAVRKGRAALREELAARLRPGAEVEASLGAMRRFQNEEVLRVGLNDVAGQLDIEAVGEELSDLADVLIASCLELASAEMAARWGEPLESEGRAASIAVVGLGKLGGRELGYHSDLDLIFVYSGPGETTGGERGKRSNGEYFAKLAQRLLSHLSVQLREGFLYKTDVRLRPSGNQGTLVVTAQAFAEHQQRRAQTWERQALLRARFVAGDEALYRRLEDEVVAPTVFREERDPRALAAEILRVRERMEKELARESAEHYDPKLGRGGIVDVEFVAQYLQMVTGARSPAVRGPSTCPALEALARAGALPVEDAAFLRQAWRFLRRLENRLRIVHDHPLRQMPRGGSSLEALARRLGYVGDRPGERLLGDYEGLTDRVRAVYERVLVGPK